MLSIVLSVFLSLIPFNRNHITSRVIDENGFPITFAEVYTEDSHTYTDSNGFFELTTVKDSITVSALSYKEVRICSDDCTDNIQMVSLLPKDIKKVK